MTGVTENEGAMFAAIYWNQLDELTANFSDFHGPRVLTGLPATKAKPMDKLKAEVIRHFYLGNDDFSGFKRQEIMDLFSDIYFVAPVVKALQFQSDRQSRPLYFYILTHKPSKSFTQVSAF